MTARNSLCHKIIREGCPDTSHGTKASCPPLFLMKHTFKWKVMQMNPALSLAELSKFILLPETAVLLGNQTECQEAECISPFLALMLSGTTGKPINLSKCHLSMCKRLIVQLVCKMPGALCEGHYPHTHGCLTRGHCILNYISGWIGYRFCCDWMWPFIPGYK